MRVIKFIVLLLVIIIGVTFATLNAGQVSINYYIGVSELPLAMILFIVFSLGVLLGLLSSFWYILKIQHQNQLLKNRITLAEKEVTNLRVIPLKEPR